MLLTAPPPPDSYSGRRVPVLKRRVSGTLSGLLLPDCLFGSPSGNFNFGKKTDRIGDGRRQPPPRSLFLAARNRKRRGESENSDMQEI